VACIHSGILFNHKNNGVLPFAVTWVEMKIIMLIEIRQAQKDRDHVIPRICGISES
jgi:hypothetical protein